MKVSKVRRYAGGGLVKADDSRGYEALRPDLQAKVDSQIRDLEQSVRQSRQRGDKAQADQDQNELDGLKRLRAGKLNAKAYNSANQAPKPVKTPLKGKR
jgi:hypothetical protein